MQVLYDRHIDVPAERERLAKDPAKYEKGLTAADKNNETFMSKVPAHIVDGLRKQSSETSILYDKTKAALDALLAQKKGRTNLPPSTPATSQENS